MNTKSTPEIDRFVKYVDVVSAYPCLLWTGNISRGYGHFRRGKEHNFVKVIAHRFIYEYHYGPIPAGLQIDHVVTRGCKHKNCVNPDHLEAVTPRENTFRDLDNIAVLNAALTHCKMGHAFDEENTMYSCKQRYCRICHRARNHKWHEKNREGNNALS